MAVPAATAPGRRASLHDTLRWLSRYAGDRQTFHQQLLQVQLQLAGAEGAAGFEVLPSGELREAQRWPEAVDGEGPPAWASAALAVADEALRADATVTRRYSAAAEIRGTTAERTLVAVPLDGAARLARIHVFVTPDSDPTLTARRIQRLEFSTGLLATFQLRDAIRQKDLDLKCIGLALHTLHAVNAQARFEPGAMAVVHELASRLEAERVSLGWMEGPYIRVWAISQTPEFRRSAELVRSIQLAMEETIEQASELLVPDERSGSRIQRATERLALQQGHSVASLPLGAADGGQGVLLVERPIGKPLTPADLESLRVAADLVHPTLDRLHRRTLPFHRRVLRGLREAFQWLQQPKHTAIKVGIIGSLLLLVVSLLGSGTYRVESAFEIEAAERRVVAMPFEGFLAEVFIRPGDAVIGGETELGRLDARDLQMRFGELHAEQVRYLKEADLALREGNPGEAAVATVKADEVQARLAQVMRQLDQTQLIAPIDGVVFAGDQQHRAGAAVERGETLFEIGDPDSLRATLLVPEHLIADVHAGQLGTMAAAAHPGASLRFEVDRVVPVAEIKDGNNVFRVICTLDESPEWLRPGVEGVARIEVGRRRLLTIWTRDVINWLRMKLWV